MNEEQKALTEYAEFNLLPKEKADKDDSTKIALALLVIAFALSVPFLILFYKVAF